MKYDNIRGARLQDYGPPKVGRRGPEKKEGRPAEVPREANNPDWLLLATYLQLIN